MYVYVCVCMYMYMKNVCTCMEFFYVCLCKICPVFIVMIIRLKFLWFNMYTCICMYMHVSVCIYVPIDESWQKKMNRNVPTLSFVKPAKWIKNLSKWVGFIFEEDIKINRKALYEKKSKMNKINIYWKISKSYSVSPYVNTRKTCLFWFSPTNIAVHFDFIYKYFPVDFDFLY